MERIPGLAPLPEIHAPAAPARPPPGAAGFASALGDAIASADALQVAADGEASKLALGAGNLHETALALEKADVSMRLLTRVRNKLVEAYQDVMRMSV